MYDTTRTISQVHLLSVG